MTATTVPGRRPWMPALNMLIGSAALATAVIALSTAPDTTTHQTPQTPTAETVVAQEPADPIAAYRRLIDGCDRIRGIHPLLTP